MGRTHPFGGLCCYVCMERAIHPLRDHQGWNGWRQCTQQPHPSSSAKVERPRARLSDAPCATTQPARLLVSRWRSVEPSSTCACSQLTILPVADKHLTMANAPCGCRHHPALAGAPLPRGRSCRPVP